MFSLRRVLSRSNFDRIALVHRRIAELQGEYGLLATNRPARNYEDLRLKFVVNEISEEKFKQTIFLWERTNSRKQCNFDILQTLQTLAVERFRQLTLDLTARERTAGPAEIVEAFMEEIEQIRIYINATFNEELPPLGSKRPLQIPNAWETPIRMPPLKRPRPNEEGREPRG